MSLYLCQQGNTILYGVTDEGQFAEYIQNKFSIGLVDPNNVDEVNKLINADWDGDYHIKIVEI